ncbi:hypothetical protein MBRU_09260 [Mycolicibacterium brumae DSM 44177]|nr:hypothetical protein MBRU_09260 [Mycolicibacterium brumae DSM 44177]
MAIVAAGLTGCSSDKSASEEVTSATSKAKDAVTDATDAVKGNPEPGHAKLSIDDKDHELSGTAVCTVAGGNMNIAVGEGSSAVAVVLAEDASTVTSVGLGNIDGVSLAVGPANTGGEAAATKDGQTYEVTGTATGVDVANPTQMVSKQFDLKVTCP